MSTQSDLLQEVAESVVGHRGRDYGPPSVNLDQRTAELWNAYFNVKPDPVINGVDVCNLMILLKMARIMENRGVKDNYADIAGYAAAAWEIVYGEF
jgi:hypothetical protein